MEEFLGKEVLETLTPNFTTTDYNSTIICKISIMGAFKKYFKYEMHLCGCGVPYIILEGTAEAQSAWSGASPQGRAGGCAL